MVARRAAAGPAATGPARRPTVRGVVVDAAGRVLLQAYLDPTVHRRGATPHTSPVWIAPGGGLAPGEPPDVGLAREWAEETGVHGVAWGAWLWRRTVELRYHGRWRAFEEHYRLGRVDTDAPTVAPAGLEPHEREAVIGYRWWPLDELARSSETVYPPRLATRLVAALADPPDAPIDISADG
jgi:ADP-ribose pyrophosphatase YjhB (NUDIX family)